jgi:surface protein
MSMKGTRDMNTTRSISRWVVTARRITVVFALFAALGVGVVAVPQPAQAAAPVIATSSTINAGAVNPVVSVTTSSSVFAPGVSVADFTITPGSTGLAGAPAFTRVSDTHVSFAFTGTAAAGEVSITAGAGAFNPDPGAGSNTVTITVPAAVNASSAPAPGSLAIVVDTNLTGRTITLWGDLRDHSKNWGDGTANTEDEHTYAAAGIYTIEFPISSGSLLIEYCYDEDSCLDGLVDVTQWGNSIVGPSAFEGAQNLTGFTAIDAPAVADEASSMFKNATRFNGNINSWDVSGVLRMNSMFQGATAFNQPLNSWNTAKVTTMYEMFNNARAFNQDLNNWNTSSVVGNGVEGMFRGATAFNGNVTTWDTSNVTTMREMFMDAKAFNQAIGVWNTANVTRMEGMFRSAEAFNQPLATNGSIWNTAKVTTMREMFNNARAFNQDLNTWVTSSVAGDGMEAMFRGATAFNGDVTTWDTANVTTMREMFKEARAFNQPIGSWSTGNVQNMENMFELATVFNQPLNLWDTSRVANMKQLFRFAEAFNQPIGSWNTGSVLTMERMFNGAKAFNYPLETWTTIQVTNMHKMFEEATVFNQPLGLWDTSNVTNMEQMFWLARGYNQSLAGLEVTGLNQSLGLFMTLSGMTPLNVDATLVGWAAQGLPTRSIALNLGNNGGSPGNLDNNFYTEGSGSVAVDALRAKGWTVSNGNFISTADSLPTPTTATMNAGDSRTFSVLLKASGSHSYTYDSRSMLSATPTSGGGVCGCGHV